MESYEEMVDLVGGAVQVEIKGRMIVVKVEGIVRFRLQHAQAIMLTEISEDEHSRKYFGVNTVFCK